MDQTNIPVFVSEWVNAHPIPAAISAVFLLGAVIIFAVRYGNMRGPGPW